jgi:hypothetical protein
MDAIRFQVLERIATQSLKLVCKSDKIQRRENQAENLCPRVKMAIGSRLVEKRNVIIDTGRVENGE